MTYEWDARKAESNRKKHGVAFEEAASVFLDPLAEIYSDPGSTFSEHREITIDVQRGGEWTSYPTANEARAFESSARDWSRGQNENNMKKELLAKGDDDLRAEYDLAQLGAGVRGKYYERAKAGTNLVLIEPDLAEVFPSSEAVNRALRVVAEAAQSATDAKRRRSRVR